MAKIDLGSVVGPVGPQGPKPVKGTDYYTEEEKQQFTTETVGLVTTEGTKQTKSVTDEGTKQVQLITEKISEITSTGDLKLNAITTEGKNKLEAVTNEGNRILSEIGKILETSPEGGNALQLGGKTRSEFDKEIQGVAGGYAGKFPLDSAVLDGIYLLPDTGKFYVCTKAFSGKSLIVPDSNFEELSVYKNRERLSNLRGIIIEQKQIDENTKYRKFDDGTLEIWGIEEPSSSMSMEHNIIFPIEFVDNSYFVLMSYETGDTATFSPGIIKPKKTKKSCSIAWSNPNMIQNRYYVSGKWK